MIKIASIWHHPSGSNKKMVFKDPANSTFLYEFLQCYFQISRRIKTESKDFSFNLQFKVNVHNFNQYLQRMFPVDGKKLLQSSFCCG